MTAIERYSVLRDRENRKSPPCSFFKFSVFFNLAQDGLDRVDFFSARCWNTWQTIGVIEAINTVEHIVLNTVEYISVCT